MTSWKVYFVKSMQKNVCAHCSIYILSILLSCGIALTSFPVLQGTPDLTDPSAEADINYDAVFLAQKMTQASMNYSSQAEVLNSTAQSYFFAYQSVDQSDIFTPSNIKAICELERQVFLNIRERNVFSLCDYKDVATDACVSVDDPIFGSIAIAARVYRSVTPSFNYQECFLLNESSVNTYANALYSRLQSNPMALAIDGVFVDSATKATKARSILNIGFPLSKTEMDMKSILRTVEAALWDECGMLSLGQKPSFVKSPYRLECSLNGGKVTSTFFNFMIFDDEIGRLIVTDFTFVIGSLAFVTFWIRLYTKSGFLSISFMLYIFAASGVAMFLYKGVLGILYFDFIHILAVFLVVGIGADDCFVVFDAWIQSGRVFGEEYSKETELQRLIYTYERSTAAVFSTSFTTFAAFVVTAITPIVPISTFGIYSALCILVLYIYTLTAIPTTVLIWDRYIRKKRGPKVFAAEKGEIDLGLDKGEKGKLEVLLVKSSRIVSQIYIPMVLKGKVLMVVLLSTLGLLGVLGTTQLKQLSGEEQFLPEDHMLQIYVKEFANAFLFGGEEEYESLYLSWGLKGVSRDLFSKFSGLQEEYKDTLILDQSLVFNGIFVNEMADTCQDLIDYVCTKSFCGLSQRLVQITGSFCPPLELREYLGNTSLLGLSEDEIVNLMLLMRSEKTHGLFGILDGELKFVLSKFTMTVTPFLGNKEKRELYEVVEEFLEDRSAKSASLSFVRLSSADALLLNVVRGLLISFAVIFGVLLWSTGNWLLSIFSVVSITLIISCVMGSVALVLGWELGTAESIVSTMIVGLSVDYAVHLGHTYSAAGSEGYEDRTNRFMFAAVVMVSTVFAGAVTTFGAGVFLYFCQIQFFYKMGVMLSLTIALSMLYSFFFLMALFALVGPQGTLANIRKH